VTESDISLAQDVTKVTESDISLALGCHKDDRVRLIKWVEMLHVSLCVLYFRTLIFGPPGNSKYPIIFFISVLLFWAYPIYLLKV